MYHWINSDKDQELHTDHTQKEGRKSTSNGKSLTQPKQPIEPMYVQVLRRKCSNENLSGSTKIYLQDGICLQAHKVLCTIDWLIESAWQTGPKFITINYSLSILSAIVTDLIFCGVEFYFCILIVESCGRHRSNFGAPFLPGHRFFWVNPDIILKSVQTDTKRKKTYI